MARDIQTILLELYTIDPSLRAQERELQKLIGEMLRANPLIIVDEKFLKELRRNIGALAREKSSHSSPNPFSAFSFRTLFSKFPNPLPLAAALLLLALAIPMGIVLFKGENGIRQITEKKTIDTSPSITALDDNAFGPLALATPSMESSKRSQGGGGSDPAALGTGQAGSAYSETNPMTAPSVADSSQTGSGQAPAAGFGRGGGGGVSRDMASPMIAPEFYQYKFVYKGGEFSIDDRMPVYRKKKTATLTSRVAEQIKNINFGFLNLDKFQNLKAQQISLTEDRDHGYMINLNLEDNSFSINADWNRWAELQRSAYTPPASPPSDQEIISIADAFMRSYDINMSAYGPGKVTWPQYHIMGADTAEKSASLYYTPDVSVLYPLKIDGKTVMDEGGNESGIYVSVNLPTKSVLGAGFESNNYESSMYQMETDNKKLINIAEQGGMYGYGMYPPYESAKITTIELGTPTSALVRTWRYDPSRNTGYELFVPALIFPVERMINGTFYQKQIVIPIAKEILNERYPFPKPMPLSEPEPSPTPLPEPAILPMPPKQ